MAAAFVNLLLKAAVVGSTVETRVVYLLVDHEVVSKKASVERNNTKSQHRVSSNDGMRGGHDQLVYQLAVEQHTSSWLYLTSFS